VIGIVIRKKCSDQSRTNEERHAVENQVNADLVYSSTPPETPPDTSPRRPPLNV